MAAEIVAVASVLTVVVEATSVAVVAFGVAVEATLAVVSAAVVVAEPQGCYSSVVAVEGEIGECQEAESDM